MSNYSGSPLLNPQRYSTKQYGATTGREVPFNYEEFTRGQAETFPAIVAAKRQADLIEEQEKLAAKQYDFDRRQSLIGTGLQGINTSITAYPHLKPLAQKYGPRIADIFTRDNYLEQPIQTPPIGATDIVGAATQPTVPTGPLAQHVSQPSLPAGQGATYGQRATDIRRFASTPRTPVSGPGAGMPGQPQLLPYDPYTPTGVAPVTPPVAPTSALSQPGQFGPGAYDGLDVANEVIPTDAIGAVDNGESWVSKIRGAREGVVDKLGVAGKVADVGLGTLAAGSTGLAVGRAFGAKNTGKDATTEAGKVAMSGGASAALALLTGANPLVGLAFGGLAGSTWGQKVLSKNKCIMVTACHGEESGEVDIAREYRDKHMSKEQIRGYYMIAERIVPGMVDDKFRQQIKSEIVDPLIEYGKWRLGKTKDTPSETAREVTAMFLDACRSTGAECTSYVRYNGEVV